MFLTNFIKLTEAKEILNNHQILLETEKIDLMDSYLRILGEDIYSLHDSPPFDKSAMDGYAVIAEDTFGASSNLSKNLKIIDQIGAGDYSNKTLKKGEAIRLATGSPVPDGADAVLMAEYTISNGDDLEIHGAVTPWENVAPQGEDVKTGDKILENKTIIRPQEMGLIASAGFKTVKVYKKPSVKLIVTGNELVDPTDTLKKAQIINSNQYTISAMIKSAGASVDIGYCKDDINAVKNLIEKETKNYDVVITTGGTAISKGDVVLDAIEEIGEVLFHGVAIRPGKPVGFGIVNNTPVFTLSGYPVGAMGQFDILTREYLFKMQHINFNPKVHKLISQVKIPSNLGRTDYVRAYAEDGKIKHILSRGSGIINSMVEANSYLIIGENQEGVGKGDYGDVIYFDSMNLNK